MTRGTIAFAAFVIVLVLFTIAGYQVYEENYAPITPIATITPSAAAAEAHPSLLYGRITLSDGTTYQGRLRWGRDQEAFWGDYFNGSKKQNPWAAHVPRERLNESIEILGFELWRFQNQNYLTRPFMARFGDIARIEMLDSGLQVTLKSGTRFDLDENSANDFGDGVRVWDGKEGALDLVHSRIRKIDLLPSPPAAAVPHRLHGTVRTPLGNFTGFVQWGRNARLGSDEFEGRTADGDLHLRFDTIRSIARRSADSSTVTLLDGREIVLSDMREASNGTFEISVGDERYGRVLISWDAFDRLDFSTGASGPAYDDFPAGRSLTGTVTTRDGRRFAGRLVYDFDESETTETLDAPSKGVDYNIPFGLIASIVLPDSQERDTQHAKVRLLSGEELRLERAGDLGKGSGDVLIFIDGIQRPEYVLSADIQQISFDRPPSLHPPQGGR